MSSIVKLSGHRGKLSSLEKYVVQPLQDQPPSAAASELQEDRDPVSEAQLQARLIKAEAEKAAADIRQAAWDEGYEAGRAAAEGQYQEMLDRAQTGIEEFEREKDEYWQGIETELVHLAVEIAEKVIRGELSTKPEAVLDIARGAIRQVRQRESVRLRVNPADLEIIKSHRAELLEVADGLRHLEVVDDRRVDRGGAMVESEDGMLDARIKTQLSEVEKALSEAANESTGHESGGDA